MLAAVAKCHGLALGSLSLPAAAAGASCTVGTPAPQACVSARAKGHAEQSRGARDSLPPVGIATITHCALLLSLNPPLQLVKADFEDPASLDAAFKGADAVFAVTGGQPGRRSRCDCDRDCDCWSVQCRRQAAPCGRCHLCAHPPGQGLQRCVAAACCIPPRRLVAGLQRRRPAREEAG